MKIMMCKEYFSCISHFVGAIAALIGGAVLAVLSRHSSTLLAVSLIYGISVTLLFSFSAIYHAKKRSDNETSIWRKLDHFAIFIMIAGTYTPLSYFHLTGGWRWGIIIAQWSLVLLGFFFKFFYLKAPRYVSTLIYIAMGWMALLVIGKLVHHMTSFEIVGLFGGGILFTIGAVIYMLKKPNPRPETMGFHGIFHIFILLGGLAHFLTVFAGLINYNRAM